MKLKDEDSLSEEEEVCGRELWMRSLPTRSWFYRAMVFCVNLFCFGGFEPPRCTCSKCGYYTYLYLVGNSAYATLEEATNAGKGIDIIEIRACPGQPTPKSAWRVWVG